MAAYTTDQHIPANAITEVLSRSSDGFNKYQNKYVSKTAVLHTRENAKKVREALQGVDVKMNLSGSVSKGTCNQILLRLGYDYEQHESSLRTRNLEELQRG